VIARCFGGAGGRWRDRGALAAAVLADDGRSPSRRACGQLRAGTATRYPGTSPRVVGRVVKERS
jgi:hypothetical protein